MRNAILGWNLKHVLSIQIPLYGSSVQCWLQEKRREEEHNLDDEVTKALQVKIVKGVIVGLIFLHNNGIVHGSLRPENVIFSRYEYRPPVKLGSYEFRDKNNPVDGMKIDKTMLGYLLWEVTGLITFNEELYGRVAIDGDHDLVREHVWLPNMKQTIISLLERPELVDLVEIEKDVPSRLTMVASNEEELLNLGDILEQGDTINTKAITNELIKENGERRNDVTKIVLTSANLHMSTTTNQKSVFQKMESRIFPGLKEPNPQKLLKALGIIMEADCFKDRVWVLFSYGTFITLDKTDVEGCTEDEIMGRARNVMQKHGPVFIATPSADYGVIRLPKTFHDQVVWLAYYIFGREICTIIFAGSLDEENEMAIGLMGRQCRQEDAEKLGIIGNSWSA
ncbi:uncharacterized protein LOC110850553 isoform X2 [Folsomia candida]|nr:uncharacterized protein LOC110850553 isoform X2 [Folsomia candida]